MVFITRCKTCPEYTKNHKYLCDQRCSKLGKEKIVLDWSEYNGIVKIKEAIENNIGVAISMANMSIYSREIEQCLKREKGDSG